MHHRAILSFLLSLLGVLFGSSHRVWAVTITELHYNPEGQGDSLEFIELVNDSSTPQDISGYSFVDGVTYTFPPNTILPARGIVVLCKDIDLVSERYGLDAAITYGNFVGFLDNGGERLTLVNQSGIVIQSFSYQDSGKWPVGADGTGHTLVLKTVHADPGEPESWTWSPQLGGTPGQLNFPDSGQPSFVETNVVAAGQRWKYHKGTSPHSSPPQEWTQLDFDDSSWDEGPVGIGYGDDDDATVLSDMQNNYVSVAARKVFQVPAALRNGPGELVLAIDFDDGFCGFVNGRLFAQSGCGSPGTPLPHDAVATASHEHIEEFFAIPGDLLNDPGPDNVIAVVGHNFSPGSSDFSLNPRIVHRLAETADSGSGVSIAFNELKRDLEGEAGWVELFNFGAVPVDLANLVLADNPGKDPAHVFGVGTSLAPGAFLTVAQSFGPFSFHAEKVRLFLFDPSGVVVAAGSFDDLPLADGTLGDLVEARFPDGGRVSRTATATPGAPNDVASEPCIVINELFYNPPEERDGEFVELHNRCDVAVDVSGFRFTRGVDFTLPDGTVMPAGGYLVIAEDPTAIEERYGIDGVLGPWEGQLSDRGENLRFIDPLGTIVDEVRYADGGDWPEWADGGGSSLELIDPLQDNDFASAWNSSDETGKVDWEEHRIRTGYNAAGESELHLYLTERGSCLVDDVSITRSGGANYIPNPGFETSTAGWLIGGTHIYSRRTAADSHGGNACLELIASGKGDTIVNRLEIETNPRMTTGTIDVSIWTKWQRGGNVLIAHGQFIPGSFRTPHSPSTNLSGNSFAKALRLAIPEALGSPGRENGATEALRAATGDGNLGPVIGGARHDPPVPIPGSQVRILARVADSDGVALVRARYRSNNPDGAFASAELFDDGMHADGLAGDGLYGGTIPGESRGTRVVYYIEATDTMGATGVFPVEAPERTLIFMPDIFSPNRLNTYSFYLDTTKTQELASRHKHSNDLLEGGFVFNSSESFYHIGVRHRGSPWGRSASNYRLKFPSDQRFHRGRGEINLSSRAGNPNEGAAYFMVGRNGSPSTPAPTADYLYNLTKYNGGSPQLKAMIQPVDRDYHRKWYGPASGGVVLKAVGRLQFDDPAANWSWEGATFVDRGSDIENYRGYYRHAMRQSMDDWEAWIRLCDVMDRTSASSAVFDANIDRVLDVEAFLRVFAPNILFNGWDQYTVGNGHNGYMAYDPVEGRWELLPFDMDNSFGGSTNGNLYASRDPDVARLLGRPAPRRVYQQVLLDYANGYWSSEGAGPFLTQLQRDTGLSTGAIINYLAGSSAHIKNTLRNPSLIAFAITTQDGQDFTTDEETVELLGTAPITIAEILFVRNGGDRERLGVTWRSPTAWQATVALPDGINEFDFQGYSEEEDLLDSVQLTITSTKVPVPPAITAWFPSSGPSTGGTEVTFFGSRFNKVEVVSFGGASAASFEASSDEVLIAITPAAILTGKVDIRLDVPGGEFAVLGRAFEYIATGFLRGDANDDGSVDVGDVIAMLLHLYRGGGLACLDAADADDNGALEAADAIDLLGYLFLNGPPPPGPFPAPGEDPTADGLGDCGASL